MKRLFGYILWGLCITVLSGCVTAQVSRPATHVNANTEAQAFPPYSGPKVRIVVADFDVKAAKATSEIGSGLREMLLTALVNSNRFSVMERPALNDLIQEQELVTSGEAASDSGSKRGALKTADLVISTVVTEFEPQTSGGRAGIGGGGGVGSGILGGLLGAALNKAHMALDIRVIDASTSEVMASTRVQGQASDISGGFMVVSLKNWALGTGLSGYANTPMEKAIRICIIEAVRYLAQTIPANYYKY